MFQCELNKLANDRGMNKLYILKDYKNLFKHKVHKATQFLSSPKSENERIYCILHGITSEPKCYCGKKVKFTQIKNGYEKYCSAKCRANCPEYKAVFKAKNELRSANDWMEISKKRKSTKLVRHGNPNYVGVEKANETRSKWTAEYKKDIHEKMKITCLERFGSTTPAGNKEIQAKCSAGFKKTQRKQRLSATIHDISYTIEYFKKLIESGVSTEHISNALLKDDMMNSLNHYTEFIKRNEINLTERIYCLLNGLTEVPKCEICKKNQKVFGSFNKGYKRFCSIQCANNCPVHRAALISEEVNQKRRDTWVMKSKEERFVDDTKSAHKCAYDLINYYKTDIKGREIGKLYCLRFVHKETKESFYKVGITSKSIRTRFKNAGKIFNISIIDIKEDTNLNCVLREKEIHKKYRNLQYMPKTKFGGYTECYNAPIKL